MKKIGHLALSVIALSIVGCGAESDSSSNGSNPSLDSKTLTVIDGYIQNAEVCVSSTEGGACVFEGETDKNGQIKIPNKYADMFVTAKIVGGKSSDSDTIGLSPKSYSMSGIEGSDVVTPFTTIVAADPSISMEDIAAKLEVEPETLNSDYIKSGNKKVHLFARTAAAHLDDETSKADSEMLTSVLEETKKVIENKEGTIGDKIDYDKVFVDIEIDESGEPIVEIKERISTPADFFEQQYSDGSPLEIYMTSLNPYLHNKEGTEALTYSNGEGSNVDGSMQFSYEFEGDLMHISSDEGKESDKIIYVSQDVTLMVPVEDRDLILQSTTDLDRNFVGYTMKDVQNKTIYYVADDADQANPDDSITPEPTFSKMAFRTNDVVMTELDESTGKEISEAVPFSIVDGALYVHFEELNPTDNPVILTKVAESKDLMVVHDESMKSLALNFYDEAFAKKVFNDWRNAK